LQGFLGRRRHRQAEQSSIWTVNPWKIRGLKGLKSHFVLGEDRMKEIHLTTAGPPAIVDDDFEWLSQWRWSRKRAGFTAYARVGAIFMHRLVTKAPKGTDVDHINHNGLDNQRANLRVVSHAENLRNRRPEAIGKRVYRCQIKAGDRWCAQISHANRSIYLGTYNDREMAESACRYVMAHICRTDIPTFDQLWLPSAARVFMKRFA
jgi:hypothetical protein